MPTCYLFKPICYMSFAQVCSLSEAALNYMHCNANCSSARSYKDTSDSAFAVVLDPLVLTEELC